MTDKNKQRWAFFSYAHNLGDFTRAVETAKGMREAGHAVKFFNHGGTHLPMLEEEGFESEILYPKISDEQDKVVMAINQFRAPVGTPLPFTEEELTKMVEADIEALHQYKPDGVYCGLNISSMISVPYMKLPRVTMVPTTLCHAFYKKRLATFPNTMENNLFIRYVLPEFFKRRLFNAIMLKDVLKNTVVTFNAVRKKFGLPPIYNQTQFVKSDMVLLPDMEELSGLPEKDLPEPYYYTGPIFSIMNKPIPEEVEKVYCRKGLNVYLSLGSSGSAETLKEIAFALAARDDINTVCTSTTILPPDELPQGKENFFSVPYLPAHQVNPLADIAITHGGQGTIQTAVWSGTPVIGTGFQSEQQANIDGLVRAGSGIRIRLYHVNKKNIFLALKKIGNPSYYENAERLQNLVRSTDGVKESVRRMETLVS